MKTEYIQIKTDAGKITGSDLENLKRAGECIKRGGLVAFPTETVYGLGGDAFNEDSADKIYAAKGRPSDNPLIVHIYRTEDLDRLSDDIPESAYRLAAKFWPGPLTMILKKKAGVPDRTTGGLRTVAVRMPSDPVAAKFIECAGGFVAAPSANISGRPSPTKGSDVLEDMDGRIDMIIDGGENEIGLESTIADLTVSPVQILRPGYITADMIGDVLGEKVNIDPALAAGSDERPRAPGMKYRHYAPKGEMVIVHGSDKAVINYINSEAGKESECGEKTGVLADGKNAAAYTADEVIDLGDLADPEEAAHRFYSALREMDRKGVTRIYAESFAESGVGTALRNRMLKASGYKEIVLNTEEI